MSVKQDLSGQKFNRLLVLQEATPTTSPIQWVCLCECGATTQVRGSSLKNGNTKSCGCLSREVSAKKGTTHGARRTRLYRIHSQMLSRCRNPADTSYIHYGARGISVCDSWIPFDGFQKWAMKNGYSDELTIDRIDPERGYCPNNCRWETKTIQSRNRRAFTNKSSGFIGVSWNKQYSKWNVTICVDGKPIHIGRFTDEVEAAKARDNFIVTNNLKGFPLNFT